MGEKVKIRLNTLLVALVFLFSWQLSWGYAADVTVTIDGAIEYQIIDGFGGAESALLPPASMYTTIFDDLGVSILRFQMSAYTESLPDQPGDEARDNDNSDPFVIDWNGVQTVTLDKFAPLLKAAQSRGVKIIGTTWSPPAWMKQNNLVESSGLFQPGYEDELVEFIVIWVKGMQMYHGVHIDSVTIQNEPDNLPPWPGCRYTVAQITDIVKRLGARFQAEGITTEIHAPDITSLKNFITYGNAICQDSDAKNYVDTLATHPYGTDAYNPDNDIPLWVAAHNLSSACGKNLWQTELGEPGSPTVWSHSLLAAQHLHNALVYGQVSAWLNFQLYKTPGGNVSGLIADDGTPYTKFYALKQYYRYVRPGAIRINSVSDDTDIMVTTFKHQNNNDFTIVVINRDTSDKIVSFNMSNLKPVLNLNSYRSSVTENSVSLGSISVSANSFVYTLPSASITTFTGQFLGSQAPKAPTGLKIINIL
jgi:O-glycosyl hydrolase